MSWAEIGNMQGDQFSGVDTRRRCLHGGSDKVLGRDKSVSSVGKDLDMPWIYSRTEVDSQVPELWE